MGQVAEFPRVSKLSEIALKALTGHGVPPTPHNYAVWFAHVSGLEPELSREIEARIAANEPFTDQVSNDLYERYCDLRRHLGALQQTSAELDQAVERVVQVIDAASGLGVLAIVIGYLPALYQAFSEREATVSQLDARAGSPPSAGRLVIRSTERGGWPAINNYLGSWEQWVAELMESHLSYPVLSYFRSQHLNQSWLATMCTVLDACALTISAAPTGTVDSSRFTFAIARHAVADLSYTLHVRPTPPASDRLPREHLEELVRQLQEAGAPPASDIETVALRLERTRALYEPYLNALSKRLELALPQWLEPESATDNWRTTAWH